jgi:hypothetical protein
MQPIRPPWLAELQEPIVVNTVVADEDCVIGQSEFDFVRGALRIYRRRRVDIPRRDRFLPLASPAADPGEPCLPRRRRPRRLARLDLGE